MEKGKIEDFQFYLVYLWIIWNLSHLSWQRPETIALWNQEKISFWNHLHYTVGGTEKHYTKQINSTQKGENDMPLTLRDLRFHTEHRAI